MIEVFKTNVEEPNEADWLIGHITKKFPDYSINFDLEDCDRILRIKSDLAPIDSEGIIALLKVAGFMGELLEDDIVVDFKIKST